MSTDAEQIRAEIEGLLTELPDTAAVDADLDIDAIAACLEAAHDVLVRALEWVERR